MKGNALMNKRIGMFILIAGMLALSACSGSTSATPATQASSAASTTNAANPANTLSVPLELAIGTFKLEGTDNAVNADTAAKLAPLWKAVMNLGASDTISQVELDGLYQQIKDTMTPAQVAAITAMHLSRTDMMQVAQEQGIAMGGKGAVAGATPNAQDQPPAANGADMGAGGPPAGGMPSGGAGGPPVGGGARQGGSGQSGDQGGGISIPNSANRSSTTTPRQAPGADFYAAVIKLLESKK
jgi:hypothetical protein